MDFWNAAPSVTLNYQFNKIAFTGKLQLAFQNKTELNIQSFSVITQIITTQLAFVYLPPSIDTAEKYKMYLDVCAI